MERRSFLMTVGAGAGALASGGVVAANEDDETEENPTPADGSEVYVPKVNEIRSPLAGVPEVVVAGDELRVELDSAIDPRTATAYLQPSFGSPVRISLQRDEIEEGADSRIWNSGAEADGSETEYEDVVAVDFEIPALDNDDAFTPDLYDLVVQWDGGEDRQPRAVSVRESIPAELDVAVIADPQLGDPRGLQSGFEESRNKEDPEPFVRRTRGVSGDRPDERWAATRRAVAEVNALDPDIVLVAGDLCLGQDAPGKFYAEYEDAWEVMNQVQAPTFITCGNHDAYVQSGTDGKALYRETFGPPSYSVAIGDVAQVVAVDTYDWSYLDRLGASVAVSTYGGQVRDAQFEWLRGELTRVADETERSILAVGHHNPSWRPDPKNRYYEETDGRPVAEQVARGSRIADSGQGWTGENMFALRRLFDRAGVDAFFCGHSHRDRLARSTADRTTGGVTPGPDVDGDGDDGDGYGDGEFGSSDYADIVETGGLFTENAELPENESEVTYNRVTYSDADERGVENYPRGTVKPDANGDTVLEDTSAGTLYVNVASTMSSTSEYWGYRQFNYQTKGEQAGLDPRAFQYDMDSTFLQERAVAPEVWDHNLDEVGLFSTPSYLLSVQSDGSATSPNGRRITITNEQTERRSGALRVSTTADDPVVDGGTVVWERDAGARTDLKIAFEVASLDDEGPPGETVITIADSRAGQGRKESDEERNNRGGGDSGGNGGGGDDDGGLTWPLG